ncbi:integral membrane protein [Colletotrichum sojae]|uniref:Integral membrane protein n=1 Tax=Colletotrichum sojae TaxID=2175907 RepID=A0A8H6IVZ6_9PEZI|nr:integral membrane protein [Colletotrichum sojae]
MSSSSAPAGPVGAAAPPPGETSNFEHPRDVLHTIHLVYMSLVQVVVVVFFFLRIYVKISAAGRFRLEDWSCLLGWLFTVLLNSTVFFKLQFGEGYHIWEITATNFIELQKWLYFSSLLYTPAAFFTKVAILLLVVRVFSVDRIVARTLHALLWFFLVCYFPAQVAKTLVCVPVDAFWNPAVLNFRCINQTKLFIYDTALGIASDLAILLVPIALTWTLRVSVYKKVKIVGLLGTGGLAVAVTTYRMYLVVQFEDSKDPTVDFVPLDWTVTGELAIGLVCACFPSINYLLEQRAAPAPNPNAPRTPPAWWRIASKKYVDVLSSLGVGCGSRVGGGTGNRTWLRGTNTTTAASRADSTARLAATPETEASEPRWEDYDIELGVLSRRPTHPFDAPGPSRDILQSVGRGGEAGGPRKADEGWLAPLPALSPLPDMRHDPE